MRAVGLEQRVRGGGHVGDCHREVRRRRIERTAAAIAVRPAGRPACHVFTVAPQPGPCVTGQGVTVAPDFTINNCPRIDILVHNAGALAADYRRSSMGVEVTSGAQLAGPYLLTGLLLDHLGGGRCELQAGALVAGRDDVDGALGVVRLVGVAAGARLTLEVDAAGTRVHL